MKGSLMNENRRYRAQKLLFASLIAVLALLSPPAKASTTYPTATIISVVGKLVLDTNSFQQDANGTTHCNQFVATFFERVTGHAAPELQALANTQLRNLIGSASWKEITNANDWNATYADAASRAKAGSIVLVGWPSVDLTAHPTPPQSPRDEPPGHIAIVMPYDTAPGFIPALQSQHLIVPMIAEASTVDRDCTGETGLDAKVRLSCGFTAAMQPQLRFFVYDP
jgi:hypothetical protein